MLEPLLSLAILSKTALIRGYLSNQKSPLTPSTSMLLKCRARFSEPQTKKNKTFKTILG